MAEVAGVPAWVWIVVTVAVVALAVGGFFLARYIRLRLVRRHLARMIAYRENIDASRVALESVLRHLADESDETLVQFAEDPDSVDRRSLAEVEQRMRLLRDDLDHVPLPAPVIPVAEALADAAHTIAVEAGRVRDEMTADEALAALGEIDLVSAEKQFAWARETLASAADLHEVGEGAVYGGGLYI